MFVCGRKKNKCWKKVIFDISGMCMDSFLLYSENTAKKVHSRSKFNPIVILDVGDEWLLERI
jgi:hypothetical protein